MACTPTAPGPRRTRTNSPPSRLQASLRRSRLARESTSPPKKLFRRFLAVVKISCLVLYTMAATNPRPPRRPCQASTPLKPMLRTPTYTAAVAVAVGDVAETNTSVTWERLHLVDNRLAPDLSANLVTRRKLSKGRRKNSFPSALGPGICSIRNTYFQLITVASFLLR